MQSNRHRKPSNASRIAARTAISAASAAAAVVVFAPAASAGTAPTVNPFPCTGGPVDSVTKGITGTSCGSGPGDTPNDGGVGGDDTGGGNPPAGKVS